MPYRGRFAPTPSGPLHLGSLVIALAGWLAARRAGGAWLLRFDDLDAPRCPAGADAAILRQLDAHGLGWDEAPDRQSRHLADYEAALGALAATGRLYACRCTRATLAASQLAGPDGPVYPGTCRDLALPFAPGAAMRFRRDAGAVSFDDLALGALHRTPAELGDFVVRRADGQTGYQLASCVDEARLGITHVVRGEDLLGSTLSQLSLMAARGQPAPRYAHLPLVKAADGRKLSKQNGAPPILAEHAGANLVAALAHLDMPVPHGLLLAPPSEVLAWATVRNDPLPRWLFDRDGSTPTRPAD